MNSLIIDNKKYVVVEAKTFEQLQEKAARKTDPIKKISLAEGRKQAHKLIDKWSKEKKYSSNCCNCSSRSQFFY